MRFNMRILCLLLLPLLMGACAFQRTTVLDLQQKEVEGLRLEVLAGEAGAEQHFLLWFEQPLDHHNPKAGSFWQRVWWSHKDKDAPVVLVTEGYSAPALYRSELATLLDANQLVVEHRFFGASVPDSLPWDLLTVEQAARDQQRIAAFFKRMYRGNWVSTGISKGGQAALVHRALFPRQMQATITYVAPFNMAREDVRLQTFFKEVGDAKTRERILAFQKELLQRRREVFPYFEDWVAERELTFSLDLEQVFELAVLEYPFSFWQWGVPPAEIPSEGASGLALFEHLYRGIDFSYFSEQDALAVGPFFYQAYRELGYYAYDAAALLPWLKHFDTPVVSNAFMVPEVAGMPVFDRSMLRRVEERLRRKDPAVLHIVGARDPWSATAFDVEGLKNSVRIIDTEGSHLTRIQTLPEDLRQRVLLWLEDNLQ